MREATAEHDRHRLKEPHSQDGDMAGAFQIGKLTIISSGDRDDWEHVSVSRASRCPTWDEMCTVKDFFWGKDETVIQYHPPENEYVNNHHYCLHLWKPPFFIPTPPSILVGFK